MVHPHPVKKIRTDNKTASGIDNNTINQHRSRATNMRYFWIRDQKTLQKFLILWKAGQDNIANYSTKHYSVKHHKHVRPIYLQKNKTHRSVPIVLLKPSLQGCVDPAY